MTNKGSVPNRHHWVPQFYLSYFTTQPNASKVYVTDVKAAYAGDPLRKVTEQAKDIAYIRHLYSAAGEQPKEVDVRLELMFRELETEAGRLWARIDKGTVSALPPGSEDRALMSRYIAAQHLRTPRTIAVAKYANAATTSLDLQTTEDAEHFFEALSQIPLHLGDTPNDMRERELFREAQTTFVDPIADKLNAMHWTMRVLDKRKFVTNDNPVYVVRRETMESWMIGDPDSIVMFPVTARHFLILAGSAVTTPDGVFEASHEAFAEAANRLTVHYSTNEAYSPFRLGEDFKFFRDSKGSS
ncbi:DUF4238 domain-containing protein [Paraburkholderia dilworthii]|uniref:DUF4238 domain-containing protein n=1 Tax=Paraburkholderia dilworthii TaxID=948106 RepID=A0ABW9D1V8_9BURK